MSIDDEICDIVEDGFEIEVNEEGRALDRKGLTEAKKKIYRKHHKVHGIFVEALTQLEYMKIVNISTTKTIFESLCSNYEVNQHVKEAKASHLINWYVLFISKEGEDIQIMFSRFHVIQSGLQELKKSYTMYDHVKKILRSLPTRFRTKVTTIQEAKDLDMLRLEDLISSLKSHEIELTGDKTTEKSKPLTLIAKDEDIMNMHIGESIEGFSDEDSECDLEVIQIGHLTKGNQPSSRNSSSISSIIKDREDELRPRKCKESSMTTWEELEEAEEEEEEEEEENRRLMVSSISNSTPNSKDRYSEFPFFAKEKLINIVKELL
jgi:hypothetical protein